ncbi:hypothetical protein [Micromonospora sp. CPCC 206061]|uniref:hypothetical protein n=1 Tax=Micromonospora sp. CPCC 206061 TaxID=3122410 RepID=UPI003FA5F438
MPIGAWIASMVFDVASHVVADGQLLAEGRAAAVASHPGSSSDTSPWRSPGCCSGSAIS